MNTETITFEQPLNEHIRICLRLEYLFAQIAHHINLESSWASRIVIQAIIEILNVIDRPDLKSKLGQVVHQYAAVLIQLEAVPNINKQKLHKILEQLNRAIDTLHSNRSKIGQELRNNEFLAAIQQRIYTPAGTCAFNILSYHLWLQQPAGIRINLLKKWVICFKELEDIVNLLLKLSRESSKSKQEIANSGFYQANLDPNTPYQMIRISLPIDAKFYPKISVGRHRLTIYFFELSSEEKATQTKHDVSFLLNCTKIWTNNTPIE